MPPLRATNLLETIEGARLHVRECDRWRRWGPYLSERQWGTVREDYSENGTAWDYFPHDHARSRAYRWGEDGIAGFGDDQLDWCVSLALWNGHDPIIKERLFGLTNEQGNHGEDVKELYFYVDGTPTHSYMRCSTSIRTTRTRTHDLIDENARRGADQPEYEILDTGVFDDNRYFDVLRRIREAHARRYRDARDRRKSRGSAARRFTCCRNSGRATIVVVERRGQAVADAGRHSPSDGARVARTIRPRHDDRDGVGGRSRVEWLFCENETNVQPHVQHGRHPARSRTASTTTSSTAMSRQSAATSGTRAAAHVHLELAPNERAVVVYALASGIGAGRRAARHRRALRAPQAEADAFYAALQHDIADADARLVQRQALAGMLWSKQYYQFDVHALASKATPPSRSRRKARRRGRNADWRHLCNGGHRVDAGQVGVPVVRVVGPRVPCGRVRADRSRLRQAPIAAAGEGALHASERPVAGLRVGVRRRQSARARVGHLARLRTRPRDDRQGRSRVSSNSCSTSCCSISPGG